MLYWITTSRLDIVKKIGIIKKFHAAIVIMVRQLVSIVYIMLVCVCQHV